MDRTPRAWRDSEDVPRRHGPFAAWACTAIFESIQFRAHRTLREKETGMSLAVEHAVSTVFALVVSAGMVTTSSVPSHATVDPLAQALAPKGPRATLRSAASDLAECPSGAGASRSGGRSWGISAG